MKKYIRSALVLCVLCLAVCAGSAAGENQSLLRDGVTWDTTISEMMALEGSSVSGPAMQDGLTGYTVPDVMVGGYQADLTYVFRGDRLAAVAYQMTDYGDAGEAFGNLRGAVSLDVGEPNLAAPDRLAAVFTALGVQPDEMPQFDTVLWSGWVLEDDNTLILLADIGGLGIICCNEVVMTGKEEAPVSSAAPAAAQDAGMRGFDTPEACAAAVAQALIAGDLRAFLDCYSIVETARGFDHTAYAQRYGAFTPGNSLLQPIGDFDIAYNEARLTSNLLMQVWGAGLTVTHPDINSLWGRILQTDDYTDEERLALAHVGSGLSLLTVQGTMEPSLEERYPEAFEKNASLYGIYGMKNWRETIVLLDLSGRTFLMPLALVQYDAGWLAAPFTPLISSVLGVPTYSLLLLEDKPD